MLSPVSRELPSTLSPAEDSGRHKMGLSLHRTGPRRDQHGGQGEGVRGERGSGTKSVGRPALDPLNRS